MVDLQKMTKEEILEHFKPIWIMIEGTMPTTNGSREIDQLDLYFTAMVRSLIATFRDFPDHQGVLLADVDMAELLEREAARMRSKEGK